MRKRDIGQEISLGIQEIKAGKRSLHSFVLSEPSHTDCWRNAVATVKFDDLTLAFAFVGSTPFGMNNAYICLDTGNIYWTSELEPLDDEVPEDLEYSDRYLELPHKNDLGLGRDLALRFTANELPGCFDRVVEFFRHKGAYARFKDLLDSEGALERWYQYEAEATEKLLREWCAENDIQLIWGIRDSAARSADA